MKVKKELRIDYRDYPVPEDMPEGTLHAGIDFLSRLGFPIRGLQLTVTYLPDSPQRDESCARTLDADETQF